ncbi:FecR domain-containing protein [Olivibacter sp. SDN3]|uniref:FecR family protein n=1 Tax=Olivibacter sp. SDN3 TaxID=2764720 RepID=UPI0016517C13|nr:FecR domain-containing protein [Olivibacter sp. SDN3]QNL49958.1 FecR domain-containing protein [Olivibacter sp. SDN3]
MKKEDFHIAQIIANYIRSESTPLEEKELNEWLNQDETHHKILANFKDDRKVLDGISYIADIDVDVAWKKQRRLNTIRAKKNKRLYLSYAAVFAAIVCTLLGIYQFHFNKEISDRIVPYVGSAHANDILPGSDKGILILSNGKKVPLGPEEQALNETNGIQINSDNNSVAYHNGAIVSQGELLYNELHTPTAGTYQLTLSDGTKVWLNALSELRFPIQFSSDERKVFLKGEAYFDIARDPDRPFKVMASQVTTEALGTQFNISAYDKQFQAILTEGVVKVVGNKNSAKLYRGQEATLAKGSLKVSVADIEKATAWKEGYFYFNEQPLKEVLEEISRWYNVDIKYKKNVRKQRITGTVSRADKLSEVCDVLEVVSDYKFYIINNKLIVYAKETTL